LGKNSPAKEAREGNTKTDLEEEKGNRLVNGREVRLAGNVPRSGQKERTDSAPILEGNLLTNSWYKKIVHGNIFERLTTR